MRKVLLSRVFYPAMNPRLFLICLLQGGLLMSCQNLQPSSKVSGGMDGSDHLADNGGFSDGSFYSDSPLPAPSGYPQEGQEFATSGGVPFSYNDKTVSEFRATPPAPAPAPVTRYVPTSADASYANYHGAEQAVVRPYTPKPYTAPVVTAAKPKTDSPKKPTATNTKTTAAKKAAPVAKKSPTVASKTGASGAGARKTSKTGGTGTLVKAVYTPPGKAKAGTPQKATLTRVHEVKRGDSLSKLASRYGVSVAALKKRNKLSSDTIVVGKRLTID